MRFKMKKFKRIKVFETAKLNAVLIGLTGLLLGIIYSFGGLLIDSLVSWNVIVSAETPGLSYGTVLAFGALVGMPAIFAACAFVATVIGAYLYNFLAK